MTWTAARGIAPAVSEESAAAEGEHLTQLRAALAPHYQVHEKLGSGGFGSVYRAVHVNTAQDVAVKVLRVQASWAPQAAANQIVRFEREAALCAALRHPNIVRLLDQGHSSGAFYYAIYELVPGETLRSLLDREHQLSIERTADLMGQVLDALATAHAAGVVHRDLKPANIMVVNTGLTQHVKVLDFGISTLTLEARDTAFHSVTRSHELVGTPQYCAPEQLRGDVPTPRTDFYAWGLVFIECIIGCPAISGSTLAELYHQHLSPLEVPLPSALVGHPLGDFLRKVLRKNPGERAADAARLFAEFRRLPLGDLVGTLPAERLLGAPRDGSSAKPQNAPEGLLERRQVTAIAFCLRLIPTREQVADAEALDPILRDQLRLCRDALVRYGGAVIGEIGDAMVVLFGYPTASDADARRAVRTVLELAEDVRHRSERLTATHGLTLQFRIGIHTGLATVSRGQVPTGITPTRALNLAVAAAANTILVSPESRRLFAPFAEIEAGGSYAVSGESHPIQAGYLVGERRGESLSFGPGSGLANSFVGRRVELGQLEEHLARSRDRSIASAAFIIGEAGIGKSRLTREFLGSARAAGRTVLEYRCLAEQRNVALSPILPVLRQTLGLGGKSLPGDGEAIVAALRDYGLDPARFVPILCAWMAVTLPSGYQPALIAPSRQRELLLEALVVILRRPIDNQGAVILFEDLHWADPTTLELIGRLLEASSETPPFLLGTARPEYDPAFRNPRVTRVNLDRLSPTDAEHLVRHVWGSAEPLPGPVLGAIVSRADGIPLFIGELTRMVAERGAGVDLNAIPITLRDSLSGRLDKLGEARTVAQIAAALGREFDGAILLAAAQGDELFVNAALEKLIESNLIYRRRRVTGSTYVFRHALIREAAYDSMPREVRRQVHARVAELLAQQFADSPLGSSAELARHHAGAGAFAAAVRCGTEAAQNSIDKSSNVEAIAQTEQVAAWIPELPAEQRIDAELRVNGIKLQALMSMQGWAAASVRELAETSRALLPRSTAHEHTASTLFALFMHYYVASQREPCRRVADELVEFAARIEDKSLQAVAATSKGVNLHAGGSFLEAEVWLEKGRSLYDPIRDQNQGSIFGMDCCVWATALLAQVEFNIGRITRGFALAQEAVDWAREIKHVPSLALALLYVSQIHQMCGDKIAVNLRAGELLETSKTYGLPAFEAYGATLASWAAGDAQGVLAIIGILKSLNCNLILTYYGSFVADIEADAGHIPQAIAHVENWLAVCDAQNEHVFDAELARRRGLYELRLANPNLDVADQALLRACSLARQHGQFRVEAKAIRDHLQLFPESDLQRARLAEIEQLFPDLR